MNDHHQLIKNLEFIQNIKRSVYPLSQVEEHIKFYPINPKLSLELSLLLYENQMVKQSEVIRCFCGESLKQIAYFNKLSQLLRQEQYLELIGQITYEKQKANKLLYHFQDPPEALYVLLKGEGYILQPSPDDNHPFSREIEEQVGFNAQQSFIPYFYHKHSLHRVLQDIKLVQFKQLDAAQIEQEWNCQNLSEDLKLLFFLTKTFKSFSITSRHGPFECVEEHNVMEQRNRQNYFFIKKDLEYFSISRTVYQNIIYQPRLTFCLRNISILENFSLLKLQEQNIIETLAKFSEVIHMQRNQTLNFKKKYFPAIFGVLSGEVKVMRKNDLLGKVNAREIFNEDSVLFPGQTENTYICQEEGKLIKIDFLSLQNCRALKPIELRQFLGDLQQMFAKKQQYREQNSNLGLFVKKYDQKTSQKSLHGYFNSSKRAIDKEIDQIQKFNVYQDFYSQQKLKQTIGFNTYQQDLKTNFNKQLQNEFMKNKLKDLNQKIKSIFQKCKKEPPQEEPRLKSSSFYTQKKKVSSANPADKMRQQNSFYIKNRNQQQKHIEKINNSQKQDTVLQIPEQKFQKNYVAKHFGYVQKQKKQFLIQKVQSITHSRLSDYNRLNE